MHLMDRMIVGIGGNEVIMKDSPQSLGDVPDLLLIDWTVGLLALTTGDLEWLL